MLESRAAAPSLIVLGLSLALPACAGGDPVPTLGGGVPPGEEADFQSLNVGVDHGPCSTDEPCGESFLLRRDGTLVHTYGGRRFEGMVSAADLERLVALSTRERSIEELRKVPGCPGAVHGAEHAEIEIVPGVFVAGEISGCLDGPLAALRYHLHGVTKRLFPDSGTAVPSAMGALPAGGPFRLPARATFDEFHLQRRWGPCPPGSTCAELLTVSASTGRVSQLGGNPRGEWMGVRDFEPLSAVAVSPAVIAELRKVSPCSSVTDVAETMSLSIGGWLYVRGSTAGCSQGPVAELRAAARALVARLGAGADAGAADHPSDSGRP